MALDPGTPLFRRVSRMVGEGGESTVGGLSTVVLGEGRGGLSGERGQDSSRGGPQMRACVGEEERRRDHERSGERCS